MFFIANDSLRAHLRNLIVIGYLNGWPAGEELPAAARGLLDGLDSDLVDEEDRPEIWFAALADPPAPGPVRDEIKAVARAVLNGV